MPEITEPTYPNHTSVVSYGVPFPELTALHLERLSLSRTYLIVSNSLFKNHPEQVQALRNALGPKVIGERIGLAPHSRWSEIIAVAEDAFAAKKTSDSKTNDQQVSEPRKPDSFVVLGGGTGTDTTKILTLIGANLPKEGRLTLEYLESLTTNKIGDIEKLNAPTAVQICIPTTLSAGEYNFSAGGVDDRDEHKKSFAHPGMSPDVVILDPALASLTPDWVWLSTGVRAIDHCIETLCSSQADEEAEKTSSEGLAKLVKGLLMTKHGADDQEGLNARLESMLGARLAMAAAIRGIPMGGSHAIGHQLGTYGVAHGHTSCIICPFVMRYNKPVNEEKQKKALEVIWESDEKVKGYLEARGLVSEEADLYDVLDAIFRELGMPRTLKEVGVEGNEKLQELAEKTLTDRWAKTNPRPLETTEQVLEILKMAE